MSEAKVALKLLTRQEALDRLHDTEAGEGLVAMLRPLLGDHDTMTIEQRMSDDYLIVRMPHCGLCRVPFGAELRAVPFINHHARLHAEFCCSVCITNLESHLDAQSENESGAPDEFGFDASPPDIN